MAAREIVLAIPFCVLMAARIAAATDTAPTRITVRVYETARLDPRVEAGALDIAGATLALASVDVAWMRCGSMARGTRCDSPPAGAFVVRLVRLPVERRDRPLPLGDAHIDTSAGAAVLATVYLDRVERVANAAGMDVQTLLGYAIAHEIGHLLLASNAHSTHGLMRPIWRDAELRSSRDADWRFTAKEIAAIRNLSQ